MKTQRISQLLKYTDWLEKAKFEMQRYTETRNVFDLANIFLSLNALPEWISKSDDSPSRLRTLADHKISIMKGHNNFLLDEEKLHELDHQLRLIRLFCNHSKHAEHKKILPQITMSARFPTTFPINFDEIQVGSVTVAILPILESVIKYWEMEIAEA